MGNQDLASRQYAVPIRGSVAGMNYFDGFEQDMGGPNAIAQIYGGDFSWLSEVGPPTTIYGPVHKINPLRVLWPHYGQLTQCYVDLKMQVASGDSDLELKLAIGKLQEDSILAETDYSQEYIDASWRRIRGSDAPLTVSSGVIEADLLDLMPALPQYGDDNFDRDLFVLIVAFNRQPSVASPYQFDIFNIHQSSTGVL